MPSVTKLLNRKKLGLGTPASGGSQDTEFQSPLSISGPGFSRTGTTTRARLRHPDVKKVEPRKTLQARPPLAQWDRSTLAQATDGFQRGVLHLINCGGSEALLLTPPSTVKSRRERVAFVSRCAYLAGDRDREGLWRGLALDSAVIPGVWENIFSKGYFEVAPSLLSHEGRPNEVSFLKKAFGLSSTDCLLLLRCGEPHACTGILAIISRKSLLKEVTAAFSVHGRSHSRKAA